MYVEKTWKKEREADREIIWSFIIKFIENYKKKSRKILQSIWNQKKKQKKIGTWNSFPKIYIHTYIYWRKKYSD